MAARFTLLRGALERAGTLNGGLEAFLGQLERELRREQFIEQLADLEQVCKRNAEGPRFGADVKAVADALTEVFRRLREEAPEMFAPGAKRKSDFFRDIAGSRYLAIGETVAKEAGLRYDMLLNVFDRSIIEVENRVYGDSVRSNLRRALDRTFEALPEAASSAAAVRAPIDGVLATDLEETYVVGTGYGRARLPFSEGAHPLRDPVPRPRRARDVSADGDRPRHRRPGHEGDPGRPARASSRTSR